MICPLVRFENGERQKRKENVNVNETPWTPAQTPMMRSNPLPCPNSKERRKKIQGKGEE
jgi:hypothetical protein